VAAEHPDFFIFESLPGAGAVMAPRLLAAFGSQRDRGSDHHAAVRALAFKWIRIVFRCWKDRVAYDESKYLAALAKRGSPLDKLVVVGIGTSL